MKTLLLTGANGYLGRQYYSYYLKQGWEVIRLGRSSDNELRIDLENSDAILELDLSEIKVNRIVHCAAVNEVDIRCSMKATFAVNVVATRALAELAKKYHICEFIYISTFHVYGKQSGEISKDTPICPLNDYGLTHYLSEEILRTVLTHSETRVLCLRPTNVYGVPENIKEFNRWTLVPFEFVKDSVVYKRITLKSSGHQYRNFVAVEDVLNEQTFASNFSVVDVYGTDTLTIRQFANKVGELVGKLLGSEILVEAPEAENERSAPLSFCGESNRKLSGSLETFIANFTKMIVND